MRKNKKAFLAITSGGIYSDGVMKAYDFNEPYLRTILGFLGITDVTTFRLEGTSIPLVKEVALPESLNQVNQFTF